MLVTPAELVAAAKADITETSVDEFHATGVSDCLLIDIRDKEDYHAGHLPGAVCAPRGMLEFNIHDLVKAAMPIADEPLESQPIVLYCGTGGRSALGAKCLQSMGYENVRSIAGGFNAWKSTELPLQSGDE